MTLEIRYVLHPGYVISRTDGDEHFISADRLARLYGVDIRCCVRADSIEYRPGKNDVHLYPDYAGNYDLEQRVREALGDKT